MCTCVVIIVVCDITRLLLFYYDDLITINVHAQTILSRAKYDKLVVIYKFISWKECREFCHLQCIIFYADPCKLTYP